MARIPIERRRTTTGAWWWMLMVAVIGVVVWLVYEWFDNDYYEDSGFAGHRAVEEVDRGAAMVPDRAAEVPGNGERLTTLSPVANGEGWRQYLNKEVAVKGLRVADTEGDRAFTVDVGGHPVLVVGPVSDVKDLAPGSLVDIDEGRVTAIDNVDELRRMGVDEATLRDERFYIRADDVESAG